MKTLMQTVVLMLMTSIMYGQELEGQWSGALSVQGNQLRIVFHVTKINNRYEATLDSPDQNASGIKVTAANFTYPNVKFEISGLGTVYEGTMSNKSITGKWVQSGTALFLVLTKDEEYLDKKKNLDKR